MRKFFEGMDSVETGISVFCLIAMTGLLALLGVGIYAAVTAPDHKGEHCVEMSYVHHAKVGYDWECTGWEKN